jgi:P-type E1-E2 ATPase
VLIPGAGRLSARHLVLDFNGTLAEAGVLGAPVARRLSRLARQFEVTVLTADTFGTVTGSLRSVPVAVSTIRTGRDKEAFVRSRSRDGVVAIGNGANDMRMLKAATLGVAVLGPEGMDPRLIAYARVLVRRIEDALDLPLDPRRIVATLRT